MPDLEELLTDWAVLTVDSIRISQDCRFLNAVIKGRLLYLEYLEELEDEEWLDM